MTIADRCRKPGDALLSVLIEAEVDGEKLTVDDMRAAVASLVSGAV
jgi:cytochrome P450